MRGLLAGLKAAPLFLPEKMDGTQSDLLLCVVTLTMDKFKVPCALAGGDRRGT